MKASLQLSDDDFWGDSNAERVEDLRQRAELEHGIAIKRASFLLSNGMAALCYAEVSLKRMELRGDSYVSEWRDLIASSSTAQLARFHSECAERYQAMLRNSPFPLPEFFKSLDESSVDA